MNIELDEREEKEIIYNDDFFKQIEKAAAKGVKKASGLKKLLLLF